MEQTPQQIDEILSAPSGLLRGLGEKVLRQGHLEHDSAEGIELNRRLRELFNKHIFGKEVITVSSVSTASMIDGSGYGLIFSIYSPQKELTWGMEPCNVGHILLRHLLFAGKACPHYAIWVSAGSHVEDRPGVWAGTDKMHSDLEDLMLHMPQVAMDKLLHLVTKQEEREKSSLLALEYSLGFEGIFWAIAASLKLSPETSHIQLEGEIADIAQSRKVTMGYSMTDGKATGMSLTYFVPDQPPKVFVEKSKELSETYDATIVVRQHNQILTDEVIKDLKPNPISTDDTVTGKVGRLDMLMSVLNKSKSQGEVLLQIAHSLWSDYGHLLPQGNAVLFKHLGREPSVPGRHKDLNDQVLIDLALIKWADNGFPTIRLGHKMSAALMTSRFDNETLDHVMHPWSSFCIEVPNDLLAIKGLSGDVEPIHKLFAFQIGRSETANGGDWAFVAYTATYTTLWRFGYTPHTLVMQHVEGAMDYSNAYLPLDDMDQKISYLIGRLIVGTTCVITNVWEGKADGETVEKENKKHHERTDKARKKGKKFAEVAPLIYRIAADIKIDLRDRVAEYLHGKGTGKKLEVRIIVQGHWRNQPYGPRNSLRKSKWIHPFERGPHDSPLLVRTKILEGSVKQ